VKPDIKQFTDDGEGIEWEDGTVTPHVDHVVLCTGYLIGFPEVEGGRLIPVTQSNEVPTLYKYMYPVELSEHNTLAILGLIQPLGAIMPIAEMQSRVFFNVLEGKTRLPSAEKMLADIKGKAEANARRYVKSPRHTIQVNHTEFMDELGDMIGCVCRPLWAFFFVYAIGNCARAVKILFGFRSPRFAHHMIFGSVETYQYRIRGPHPWEGAVEASLTVDERVKQGTMSRNTGFKPLCESRMSTGKKVFAVGVALGAVGYAGWVIWSGGKWSRFRAS
jgi:dimethylaniline monooxygenase (N-oxide forming)